MRADETTSLKQALQGMFGGEVSLVFATVTKEDPLEVTAEGDDKLIISDEILIVPEHLTDRETEVTITEDYGWETKKYQEPEPEPGHKHKIVIKKKKIKIHGKLKKGDTVALLALAHGKHYFVLDRM